MRPEVTLLLSAGGVDESAGYTGSVQLLHSRALIPPRKAGLAEHDENYGTKSSNPLPSSGESANHRFLSGEARFQDTSRRRRGSARFGVTPSAVSERFSELLGCPISRSLTTSCVYLELRPLPSTGITRLQRYYEPLRHPSAPGLCPSRASG